MNDKSLFFVKLDLFIEILGFGLVFLYCVEETSWGVF